MNTSFSTRAEDRLYLPARFRISVWSKLKPYYNELLHRPIHSSQELKRWMQDKRELDQAIAAELEQRLQTHEADKKNVRMAEAYEYMQSEIYARILEFEKEIRHQMTQQLPEDLNSIYQTYYKG